MNCGSEIGNAPYHNRKLAEEKNLQYMGTAKIIMPENYIALFRAPSESKEKEIIKKAEPQITAAAETIL